MPYTQPHTLDFPVHAARSRRTIRPFALALLLNVAAASGLHAQKKMSGEAKDYLKRIVEIMREQSLTRDTVNWKAFEANVMKAGDSAQTIAETYPAIRVALTQLGDRMGRFRPAQGQMLLPAFPPCRAQPIKPPTIPANVGYIRVEGYRGQKAGLEPYAFAGKIQGTIKAGDEAQINEWIVDVRGLNMPSLAPAITGLGSLLGDGLLFYFVDSKGRSTPYEYQKGELRAGNSVFPSALKNYELTHKQPKVAVLVDGGTGGTGEVIVAALKGRRDAHVFGTPTCGLAPGEPQQVKLEDGGTLMIGGNIVADKNHKKFQGPITPDELVEDPDQVVERAIAWLTKGN